MEGEAVGRLYQAFVSHDPVRAIAVIEKTKGAGVDQERLFDQLFAPAMSLLGAAWAKGTLDEYAFTQAAVVAEQVISFVTPPVTAPDSGITVLVCTMQGDLHTIDKSIVAAALTEAGHRVIDLGQSVRPTDILERAEETGAPVVIVFAHLTSAASSVVRVREMLATSDRAEVALLVSGGPFVADTARAKAVGANGVVRGAESALRLVEKAAKRAGRSR